MSVDGKYQITLDSPIGKQKAALEFVTRGFKLGGSMTGAMGTLDLNGSADDNRLTWTMEGAIVAAYARSARWECTATVAGDSIIGEAKIADVGTAPFSGSRVESAAGHAAVHKATLPWKDLGEPRYEAVSVDWVNALNEWVKEKIQGKHVNVEMVWSVEYTDPPAHLVRGDGRNTIGYHFRAKGGTVEALDGPLPSADITVVYPYDPFAVTLRLTTDQYVEWMKENAARVHGKVKHTGDMDKVRIWNELLLAGTGNDIREEFFAQQSLSRIIRCTSLDPILELLGSLVCTVR